MKKKIEFLSIVKISRQGNMFPRIVNFVIPLFWIIAHHSNANAENQRSLVQKIFSQLQDDFVAKEHSLDVNSLEIHFKWAEKNIEIIDNYLPMINVSVIYPEKLFFKTLEIFDIEFNIDFNITYSYDFNFGSIHDAFQKYFKFCEYIKNSSKWYKFLNELEGKLSIPRVHYSRTFVYSLYQTSFFVCIVHPDPFFINAGYNKIFRFVNILNDKDCRRETEKIPLNHRIVDNLYIEDVKSKKYCKMVDDMLTYKLMSEYQMNRKVITGKFIHLNEVLENVDSANKIIEIFAERKVFIDSSKFIENIDQLNIIAPVIEIIPSVKCSYGNVVMCDMNLDEMCDRFVDCKEGFLQSLTKLEGKCVLSEKIELKLRRGSDELGLSGSVLFMITEHIKNEKYLKIDVSGGTHGKGGIAKIIKLNDEHDNSEIEIVTSDNNFGSDSYQHRLEDVIVEPVELLSIQDALNDYKAYVLEQILENGELTIQSTKFYEKITHHYSLSDSIQTQSMTDELTILNNIFSRHVSSHLDSYATMKFDYWINLYESFLMRVNEELKNNDSSEIFGLRSKLSFIIYSLKYATIEEYDVFAALPHKISTGLTNIETSKGIQQIKSDLTEKRNIIKEKVSTLRDVIYNEIFDIYNKIIDNLVTHAGEIYSEVSQDNIYYYETTLLSDDDEHLKYSKEEFLVNLSSVVDEIQRKTKQLKKAVDVMFDLVDKKDNPNKEQHMRRIKYGFGKVGNLGKEILRRQFSIINNLLYNMENKEMFSSEMENFKRKVIFMKSQWNRFQKVDRSINDDHFNSIVVDLFNMRNNKDAIVIDKLLSLLREDYYIPHLSERRQNITLSEGKIYEKYFQNMDIGLKLITGDIVRSVIFLVSYPNLNSVTYSKNIKFKINNLLENLLQVSKDIFGKFTDVSKYVQEYQDLKLMSKYAEEAFEMKATSAFSGLFEESEKNELVTCNFIHEVYQRASEILKMYLFPFAEDYMSDVQLTNFFWTNYSLREATDISDFQINNLEKRLLIKDSHDENLTESFEGRFFYVWKHEFYSTKIDRFLAGEEVELEANIQNGMFMNAVKFNRITLNIVIEDESFQETLTGLLKNFVVHVKHSGENYYKCANRYYLIRTSSLNWILDFNTTNDDIMAVKMQNGDATLSPYTTWTFKLEQKVPLFPKLLSQMKYNVDLILGGDGTLIENDVPCDKHLEKYYMLQL